MNEFNKDLLKKVYIKNNMIYVLCGFDFINKKYLLKSIGICKVYTSIEKEEVENLKDPLDLIDFYFLENIKNKTFIEKYEKIENSIKNKDELLGFINLLNRQKEILENQRCLNILKNKENSYKKEFNDLIKGQKRLNKRFFKYFGKDDYDFMINFLKEKDFKPIGYVKHLYKENLKIIEELKNIENI